MLVKAEKDYYDKVFKENSDNLKKSWRILKEIINKKKTASIKSRFKINGKITSDKNAISNGFNSFFVNIGPELAKKIPQADKIPVDFLQNRIADSMFVIPALEEEIISTIKNHKLSSPGWDEVSPIVMKATYNSVIKPLTHVLNMSLNRGVFPLELKIAKVIPLFKSGDIMDLSNYRPVSVLPLFSKVLERLMYTRLLSLSTNIIFYILSNLGLELVIRLS